MFLAAGPVRGLQSIIYNLGSGDLKEATIWEFEMFLTLVQSEDYWATTAIWVHVTCEFRALAAIASIWVLEYFLAADPTSWRLPSYCALGA